MAKKVLAKVRLQINAGQANPAPPVGSALGPHGINLMEFCKSFNEKTQKQVGLIIPCDITIYADRSFSFLLRTPPAAVLLKKAAGIPKGSSANVREKIGTVTMAQVREIAQSKLVDLNTDDLDAASRIILGTARSMGLTVTD